MLTTAVFAATYFVLTLTVFAATHFALNSIIVFIARRREMQKAIQRDFNHQSWVDLGAV